MHQSTTRSLLAVLFLISAVMKGEEEHPRACKAVHQLIQSPGCRLTECRLGGFSTVLLGSEEGPRYETRGDLVMLDRECEAKLTIPALFAAQKQKLLDLGFVVQGSEQVKENYGAIVLKTDGQWLELTGLVLEGVPTLSLRSVRMDHKLPVRNSEQPLPVPSPVTPTRTVLTGAQPVLTEASTSSGPNAGGAGQDRQPRVLARADAIPPAGLERAAASGISVEVALDERGSIARVLSTKGNPALLTAALQAVRNWTFEPALASGKPVPGVLQLDVSFKTAVSTVN
jgi:hypothetical protein